MGILDVPFNRNVNVNNLENPFGTYEGQQVVSERENFWARLGRLGRIRSIFRQSTSFAAGSYGTYTVQFNTQGTGQKIPALGHVFYPQCITVSTTVDAEVWIDYYLPTVDNQTTYVSQSSFVKANTPFQWYPDGSIYISSGDGSGYDGGIVIRIGGPTAGNYKFTITGVEIARGDV